MPFLRVLERFTAICSLLFYSFAFYQMSDFFFCAFIQIFRRLNSYKSGGFYIRSSVFVKNGIIMAAAFLVIKSAGMLFRVFLAGRLGAEGLGLYQLVMSVYLVFAATVSSGVCLCASRL